MYEIGNWSNIFWCDIGNIYIALNPERSNQQRLNFYYKKPVMSVLTCYVVDDDSVSRHNLRQYILDRPCVCIKAEFEEVHVAVQAFHHQPVQLLIVNNDMPNAGGGAWFEILLPKPYVFLLSSNPTNQQQSKHVTVLQKPVNAEALMLAFSKLQQQIQKEHVAAEAEDTGIIVRDHKDLVNVDISEIRLVEALGDYLKLHVNGRFYTMLGTMKQMEERLRYVGFIRVHRSYLVAIAFIEQEENGAVIVGGKRVPVSDSYKAVLMAAMKCKTME